MMEESLAYLDLPANQAMERFESGAQALGLRVERSPDMLRLRLKMGTVEVMGEGPGTGIRMAARDAVNLQVLRDLMAERLGQLGVTPRWLTRATSPKPANLSLAEIVQIVRISPSFVRVTIEGSDLGRLASGGMHFRILLGPENAGWPAVDSAGITVWPGGAGNWHRPVYTTRHIEMLPKTDSAAQEVPARITFDVFLHDGGRVTEWVLQARPGDEIALTGPGGSDRPEAGWIGIIGDETALPVAARILAEAPLGTRGAAVLFVPEAADIQDLQHPEGVSVRWVTRGGAETPLSALEGLDCPENDRYVFFAAERQEAVAARKRLTENGFGRGDYHAAGYWSA
ncbi:NADPH-dependent ferric siderophore reductase, contains FAD-binding and SIP domains [Roseovarius pacificus]|uniref:NADPH-dependent ferric siderophore reductase, contains FAD-binding and SIP domains n=1 Tax=Roseovarius pacificus TaxID=337701 RepID=A0A1M7A574_9RHOB|nr:siderophore-interacting protein [Roseovarius pacificus]GGO53868.1 siderophore-interacting protein [Roseovarius pacificus]SHL37871.1 NADPH-dependent ferric siderophore reductase, contains FAD-binding and SIP domains [Roseovarius pacificus]